MQELLSFANHLADESGKVITRYFRKGFAVERKGDDTPVTIADRSVEAELRKIIEAARPDDGILGEEYGPKESRSGYIWVLDPIDGTKSFVVGRPTFGTLIALCKENAPILGVIDQPILKERWVGDGARTTFNGHKISTRKVITMKECRVASTAPAQLPDLWQKLDAACAYTIWGGDCYSYGLLANGGLDCVIETGLAPYDYLALAPIVSGAGGWMGDWNGAPLTLQSDGRTIALGNPALKDSFLDFVANQPR
jgi:inositol-phosphate phosphatase / L-galactose 1-phosphate phosphatase / histidinol-phosphatase